MLMNAKAAINVTVPCRHVKIFGARINASVMLDTLELVIVSLAPSQTRVSDNYLPH